MYCSASKVDVAAKNVQTVKCEFAHVQPGGTEDRLSAVSTVSVWIIHYYSQSLPSVPELRS